MSLIEFSNCLKLVTLFSSYSRVPGGCGEQNMIGFVPNIVAINYLSSVGKLTAEVEIKAKRNMETGYQRQLSYKRNDGSYSAFGNSDKSGSTWLTAYVVKSYYQASKFIAIDEAQIQSALNFLSSQQAPEGNFKEPGNVIHKDMQGESSKGLALTAYVLITFLEIPQSRARFTTTINKALDYVVKNTDKLEDTYSLALVAYALQLANHASKTKVLATLNSKATKTVDEVYWAKPIPAADRNNPWYYRPISVNVEMTSYALQTILATGVTDSSSFAIMRWMVKQRNSNGGFSSTQDTVVGLQALAKLAAKIYSPNSKVDITVKSNAGDTTLININKDNSLVLQKFELNDNARQFDISARGKGLTILQISYRYNVANTAEFPRFTITPTVLPKSTKTLMFLEVCTTFIPDSSSKQSNMAIMEVSFPSGYTYDQSTTPELRGVAKVKVSRRRVTLECH